MIKEKILIVDDVEINRKILENMLRNNYEVLEAGNGKEAIAVLEQNEETITMILLDLSMPVMGGYEFMEYKKQRKKWDMIPIMVITSEDTCENEIRALELGAKDFMPKPYNEKIILLRMNNIKNTLKNN